MCDCEMPTVFKSDWLTACIAHRCCECFATIWTGEMYYRARGLWDGIWSTHKVCERCQRLRRKLEADTDCCYPFLGMLIHVIEELDQVVAFDRPLDVEYIAFYERAQINGRKRRKQATV